jgi:hypothetical protein
MLYTSYKVVVVYYIFANHMVVTTYNFHATCLKSQNKVDYNHIYFAYYIYIRVHFAPNIELQ